eukprot:scaffold1541_cov256-Pinguiococcus_pyrenoidosus.AAC.2
MIRPSTQLPVAASEHGQVPSKAGDEVVKSRNARLKDSTTGSSTTIGIIIRPSAPFCNQQRSEGAASFRPHRARPSRRAQDELTPLLRSWAQRVKRQWRPDSRRSTSIGILPPESPSVSRPLCPAPSSLLVKLWSSKPLRRQDVRGVALGARGHDGKRPGVLWTGALPHHHDGVSPVFGYHEQLDRHLQTSARDHEGAAESGNHRGGRRGL